MDSASTDRPQGDPAALLEQFRDSFTNTAVLVGGERTVWQSPADMIKLATTAEVEYHRATPVGEWAVKFQGHIRGPLLELISANNAYQYLGEGNYADDTLLAPIPRPELPASFVKKYKGRDAWEELFDIEQAANRLAGDVDVLRRSMLVQVAHADTPDRVAASLRVGSKEFYRSQTEKRHVADGVHIYLASPKGPGTVYTDSSRDWSNQSNTRDSELLQRRGLHRTFKGAEQITIKSDSSLPRLALEGIAAATSAMASGKP